MTSDACLGESLREAWGALAKLLCVHNLTLRYDDGIPVITAYGSNLTMQDYDAIIGVKWDVLARHPGPFFDVDINDDFGDAQ